MLRITFAVVLVSAILAIVAGQEDLYPDTYDHIEPMEILVDNALRNQYYKCFMDTGPCVTEDAQFFKLHFSEAVATRCRRCTDKQKDNFAILVEWYTANQPDEWKALMVKALEDAKAANVKLD